MVERLAESRHEIESVLVQEGRESLLPSHLPTSVPIFRLPKSTIRSLAGFDFHRGILACGVRERRRSIDDLITHVTALPPQTIVPMASVRPVVLALMNVTCPENLGSLFRTAAALGIERVIIGPGTLDHLSRRVIRVSMGAAFHHHFYQFDDVASDLTRLRDEHDFEIIATTLRDGAVPLDQWNPSRHDRPDHDRLDHDAYDRKSLDREREYRPTVLMLGNEAAGLEPSIENLATRRVTIPMHETADSLNVAVAGAIFMHELTRRRDH